MEIKLSDEDMEALARIIERKIADRVIGILVNNAALDGLSERAKMWAVNCIDERNFADHAIAVYEKRLADLGDRFLRTMVQAAVRTLAKDDPELRKAIAKEVVSVVEDYGSRIQAAAEEQ